MPAKKSKRETVESIGKTLALVERQIGQDEFTLEDIDDRIRVALDALIEMDAETPEAKKLFVTQVARDAQRLLYEAHKKRDSPSLGMRKSLYAESELDYKEAKEAYVKALQHKLIDTANAFGGSLDMKIKALEGTLKAAKGTASPFSQVVAHFVNGEMQSNDGDDDEDENDD